MEKPYCNWRGKGGLGTSMLAAHTTRSKATMNDGFALEQQNLVEIHINNNAGYHSTRTYLAAKKDKNSGLKMDRTLTFNLYCIETS